MKKEGIASLVDRKGVVGGEKQFGLKIQRERLSGARARKGERVQEKASTIKSNSRWRPKGKPSCGEDSICGRREGGPVVYMSPGIKAATRACEGGGGEIIRNVQRLGGRSFVRIGPRTPRVKRL